MQTLNSWSKILVNLSQFHGTRIVMEKKVYIQKKLQHFHHSYNENRKSPQFKCLSYLLLQIQWELFGRCAWDQYIWKQWNKHWKLLWWIDWVLLILFSVPRQGMFKKKQKNLPAVLAGICEYSECMVFHVKSLNKFTMTFTDYMCINMRPVWQTCTEL